MTDLDPEEDTRHRCQRGRRCRNGDDQRRAAFTDDPFCRPCALALDRALRDAPEHLRLLHDAVARPIGGGALGDVVSGSKAPPAPVDVAVMTLAEDFVFVLATWDRTVRHLRRLTAPAYTRPPWRPRTRIADRGAFTARQAHVVDVASTSLSTHTDVLLAAPEHAIPLAADERDSFGEYEHRQTDRGLYLIMSGTDAAGWIIDFGGRVRSRLGLTRLTHRLPYPCPACDVAALERADGSDIVRCQACSKPWTLDNFEVFVRAWGKIREGRSA